MKLCQKCLLEVNRTHPQYNFEQFYRALYVQCSACVTFNLTWMCVRVCVSDSRAPVETTQEEEGEKDDDDASVFHAKSDSSGPFTNLRWSTRVFAVECVCRIIAQCEHGNPAHFDMALAQELRLHESTGESSRVPSTKPFFLGKHRRLEA